METSGHSYETLLSDNILLLKSVAKLSEEVRTLTAEKNAALAIVNADHKLDFMDLSPWINEASAYFALNPFTTDTEMSQFLWELLTDIRTARMEGIDFYEEDLDA